MDETERLRQVMGELKRRETEVRCEGYVPNGKVSDFIRVVGGGGHFVAVLSAANGLGKTAGIINILANLAWGPQNEWFNHPIFRNFPYPKRVRIGTEPKNLEEIGAIDQEIKTWWPKGRYTALKNGRTYVSEYRTDTDWVFDKMSYEQDTKDWESATLGVAVFDEPPPKEKFAATVSRMRRGGLIIIGMTPLSNAAWIMDDLVDSHSEKTAVVYGDIEDNCKEHGVRGILEHSHIQQMIENMDPDEVDARAHGKAMHLSSVILGRSFKREFHVVPDDYPTPSGSQWFTVVDPARGKPWAIGVGWVDARGQIVFDDEYPKEDWLRVKETKLMLKDYADILRIMESGKQIEYRIFDRHYSNQRNDVGSTLKQDLAEKYGIETVDSYSCEEEVESGVQKIKNMLGFNDKMPIDSQNFPRLRIKSRCKNIIRAMERWPRNPKTLRPDENSPYKDHADLVRYACGANIEVWVPRPFRQKAVGYVLGR